MISKTVTQDSLTLCALETPRWANTEYTDEMLHHPKTKPRYTIFVTPHYIQWTILTLLHVAF